MNQIKFVATYPDSKDLTKRTVPDKVLKVRAYKTAQNPKYEKYQRGQASTVYNLYAKTTGSGTINEPNVNEVLPQELHKPVIKKLKRRKVYARFKDNIQAADLAEMGSLSTKNWSVKYSLCFIDIFTKYA